MVNKKKLSLSASPEPPVLERQDTVEQTNVISTVDSTSKKADKTKSNVKTNQGQNTRNFTAKRAGRKSIKKNEDIAAVVKLDNMEEKSTPNQEENKRTPLRKRKTPNKYEDLSSSLSQIKKSHLEMTPIKNKGSTIKERKPLTNGRKNTILNW